MVPGLAVRTMGKTKTKKRVMDGGKTKMTIKWNLINLDMVPHRDKLSSETEEGEEGKLFFRDAIPPYTQAPFPPRLKRQRTYGF